jgi:methanogenic corrinoid protein MtbC1
MKELIERQMEEALKYKKSSRVKDSVVAKGTDVVKDAADLKTIKSLAKEIGESMAAGASWVASVHKANTAEEAADRILEAYLTINSDMAKKKLFKMGIVREMIKGDEGMF